MDWLNKEQLRGIGSVAGGRGLGNAAEFVAMALAARMLGPAEYGKFAYFIAIAMVSGQLFDLGLGRILAVRTSLLLGAHANDATVGRTYGALLGLRMYGVAVVPLLLAAALWERQFQLLLAGLAMGFLISTLQCLASIFLSQLQFGKYSASIWLPGVAHLAGVVALIGGTIDFWEANWNEVPDNLSLTIVNLVPQKVRSGLPIRSITGDARHLSEFGDGHFDYCSSNSVIEHVGTLDDQRAMAKEVRRVASGYFLQTPYRYFPIEPHFQVPLWAQMPLWLRTALHQSVNLGSGHSQRRTQGSTWFSFNGDLGARSWATGPGS